LAAPGPGRVVQQTALEGVKHSVAIASGKGGVGKSTVSVNLAVALAQTGMATGLLDADLYGPSIPIMTGVRRTPTHTGERLIPIQAHGVHLMSLGFLMPEGSPVVWRGPMVSGAIQQFLREVEWGVLDTLLVDLPPGTGDAPLTLAQSIPLTGAVIVTTPQDVSRQIAAKALAMFRQLRVPILGIVENMSGFVCPHCGTPAAIFKEGGGRRSSEQLGVPFLGAVPLDAAVVRASDRGEPMVTAHPTSPVAEAYRRIAGLLAGELGAASPAGPRFRVSD